MADKSLKFLTRRGFTDKTISASEKPHGERMRYIRGCRCDLCKRANTDYENMRSKERAAGNWNGLVSANKAKKHLIKLSKAGVGRRAVADVSDVGETALVAIKSGKKLKIRAITEKRILAVTFEMAAADRALISAIPSWKLINDLIAQGYTKVTIAEAIGQKRALQLGKDLITIKNADLVRKAFEKLNGNLVKTVIAEPVVEDFKRTPTGIITKHIKNGMNITVHKLL